MRAYVYASILFLVAVILIGCVGGATPTTPALTPAATATPKSGTVSTPIPASPSPARSTPATIGPPYYEGKTIEIIVTGGAGGGSDTVARIVASYWPKYIPGNPKIVIRNQPGGGGTVANNSFVEKARPNGFTLISIAPDSINAAITRPDIAHYDPAKYEYVGNISRAPSVLLVKKDSLARLSDSKAKPVHIAAREGNESWVAMPLWGQEFLGWNLKWILGFGGASEIELALRRGEIDMFATATARTIQALIDEGLVAPIAQEGMLMEGKIVGRPDFADVPIFEEVLGAKKPSGLPWQAYKAWISPSYVDKVLAAPPGTPANIMNILTNGYRSMSKDRQFDETVKKLISAVYSVGVGQETATMIKEITATPREGFKYGADLQRKFGIISK